MRAFRTFRFWKINTVKYYWGIDSADSGYIAINGEKTADMDEKR